VLLLRRLWGDVGEKPLFEDEAVAGLVAARPVGELLGTVMWDRGGAPLHFLIAHAGFAVSGGWETLRWLSVAAALASVPVCFDLGRRLGGEAAGAAAALVVATSHASREGTIALTRLAQGCGADCAMVNPPALPVRAGGSAGDQLVALFRALSERVRLPLMIQDAGGNATVDILLRAAREASTVVAGKLESPGAVLKIGRFVAGLREAGLLAGAGSAGGSGGGRVTVLGGAGGNYLPEELEAGAVGTMPHPAIIDAFRTVCDRYAAGDPAAGYEAYLRQIVPLLRAVAMAGPGQGDGGGTMVWVHKALLVRAGVLRTTYCRAGNTPAPAPVMARVWEHVERTGLLVARRAAAR
jgi:4-hydroxy-tetrahydrodipicolinate synthase